MRVAIYVHCYFPDNYFGTEAYARSIAHELAALGHRPFIITTTQVGETRQNQYIEHYVHENIPVVRIDRNVRPNFRFRDTFYLPDLKPVHEQILREIKPDVVHICHLINHTATLLEVTRAFEIPTFATFTDFHGFCFTNILESASGELCAGPNASRSNCVECLLSIASAKSGALRYAKKVAADRLLARALVKYPSLAGRFSSDINATIERPQFLSQAYTAITAAVAPTKFCKEVYAKNGIKVPVEVSRFGIDIDRSPKPARPGQVLQFGYIGQLKYHKGVDLILRALPRIGSQSFALNIWGDETRDPEYSASLHRLAGASPVRFRGTFPVMEIADVLKEIDVLLIPSRWPENSPLILLQALATHTPAIVSDVAGLTEMIAPEVNGFTVKRNDVEQLAAAMRRFTDDAGLAERLSVQTSYDRTSRAMVEDLLGIFRRFGVDGAA